MKLKAKEKKVAAELKVWLPEIVNFMWSIPDNGPDQALIITQTDG